MPSSMCWPCEDSRQRTSVCGSSANQSMRSPMFQTPAWLIQPPRFVDDATSGETVTTRFGDLGIGAREVDEEAPERLLRRGAARVHAPDVARHGARLRDAAAGRAAAARPRRRQSSASGVPAAERRPRVGDVGAELLGELRPLLVRHERGVVGRMPLRRQPARLDRVGEDHGRAVAQLVGAPEGVEQVGEVVPAEIGDGGRDLGVVELAR